MSGVKGINDKQAYQKKSSKLCNPKFRWEKLIPRCKFQYGSTSSLPKNPTNHSFCNKNVWSEVMLLFEEGQPPGCDFLSTENHSRIRWKTRHKSRTSLHPRKSIEMLRWPFLRGVYNPLCNVYNPLCNVCVWCFFECKEVGNVKRQKLLQIVFNRGIRESVDGSLNG